MRVVVQDWLAPSSVRWPDRSTGPWIVTLTWREAGDRAECVGLDIQSVDRETSTPITATLMRSVPIAHLIAEARRERYMDAGGELVEDAALAEELDIGPHLLDQLEAASRPWGEPRRGRPVDLNEDFYREVATAYSDAVLAGMPPLQAVEKRWTTSRPTASRWVAAARRLGLLPPTKRGRARGADVTTDEGEL